MTAQTLTRAQRRCLRRFVTHDGQMPSDKDADLIPDLVTAGYVVYDEDGFDGPCWDLTEKGRKVADG